jgi:hypothetical protein
MAMVNNGTYARQVVDNDLRGPAREVVYAINDA